MIAWWFSCVDMHINAEIVLRTSPICVTVHTAHPDHPMHLHDNSCYVEILATGLLIRIMYTCASHFSQPGLASTD